MILCTLLSFKEQATTASEFAASWIVHMEGGGLLAMEVQSIEAAGAKECKVRKYVHYMKCGGWQQRIGRVTIQVGTLWMDCLRQR